MSFHKKNFFGEKRMVWKLTPESPEQVSESSAAERLAALRKEIEANFIKNKEKKVLTSDNGELVQTGKEESEKISYKQEILEKAIKLKEKLGVDHLYMLEKIAPGSLKQLFAQNGKVDFGNNRAAEQEIGLGSLLQQNQPPYVMVKKPNGVIQFGKRTIGKDNRGTKEGYWEIGGTGDYLEILNGYEFQSFSTLAEMQALHEEYSKKAVDDDFIMRTDISTEKTPPSLPTEQESNQAYSNRLNMVIQEKREADEILKSIGIESKKKYSKSDSVLDALRKLTPEKINQIRRSGSGEKKLKEILRQKKRGGRQELKNALDEGVKQSEIQKMNGGNELLQVFGGIENLKSWLLGLAKHESGFNSLAISSTGCSGYFQFNKRNSEAFHINPFRAEDSVRGVIRLWCENAKSLKESTAYKNFLQNPNDEVARQKAVKLIVIAHNRGVPAIKRGDYMEKDAYGNPTGDNFYASVRKMKKNNERA